MATIRLDFANPQLQVGQRARLVQAGANLPTAPLSLGTAAGERMAEAGQALSALAEVERRTHGQIAQNRGRAAALRALAEAEDAAGGDIEQYRRLAGEALQRIGDGIADPRERERFLAGVEPEAASVEFRVRRAGRARLGAEAVASLEEALRETGTRAALAADPVEAEQLRRSGRERIQAAIDAGFLNPAAARERVVRWERDVSVGQAQRLIRDAPGEAERMLRDPDALPGLSIEDRSRLLDRATREARRAAGGPRRGGGARGAPPPAGPTTTPDGFPLPPPQRPRAPRRDQRAGVEGGEDEALLAAVEAEGEAWAEAEDDAERQRSVLAEAEVLLRGETARLSIEDAWMLSAAGEDTAGTEADPEALAALADPVVQDAARAVTLGVARADDATAAAMLLRDAGELPEPTLRREAARAVAEGRLSAGGFVRVVSAGRETRQDREWARVREAAAQSLDLPDVGDVAPGLDGMDRLRADALAEMDRWRAANPRAGAGPSQAAAGEVARRAREAMAEGLAKALPRVPGLSGAGPWGAAALDEAEDGTLAALDAGEVDEAEAARRLRALDGWRWVASVFDGGEEDPDPDAPGGGRRGLRGMRVR